MAAGRIYNMTCPSKIVIIRSTYRPYGGVERVALSMINGLLKKGVEITLLTAPRQPWPVSDANLNIIPVGISRGHRFVQAWLFNHCVNRYLSSHKTAFVLSLDKVTNYTHLHAGGGTHRTFLRIKNQYQGKLSRFLNKLSLFHNYIKYVEKKGFNNPRLIKVRCNSKMVMDVIQRDYTVPSEKLVLVHSGIRWKDMEDFFLKRQQFGNALCQDHCIDPQWKCLLFLGSGFLNKGLDIAIRGLGAMPADYHLIVVGKGSIGRFQKLITDMGLQSRIHFLGPKPDGWRYASFCNALVLPSQYDPFGGAAAEGHAMGLPVLVSDKTGYADRVIHGENGVILETPMTAERIENAFRVLTRLIECPVRTPEELRSHARNVDDDVILEKLLENFLTV
jgi:UDP-glucose:(heptosyl)LPS alpha-1,3-glucosyltransferase